MDSGNLLLDERFHLLLHKKIMDKKGSAMRRAKKYYKDQYKKNRHHSRPSFACGKRHYGG